MFKQQIQKSVAALAMLLVSAGSAWALEPIPTQSGFSGELSLRVGVTDSETNLVKGTSLWEIGSEQASALDSGADDEDDTFPIVGAELAYTFGNRNQVFLGHSVIDIVSMDILSEIGYRKEFEQLGIISIGLLTNGLQTMEVWRDPYDTTVSSRSDTDMDASGVRFQWGWIGGIPVEFDFEYVERDVDKERSGAALVAANTITAQQATLLERDGDDYRGELRYVWRNEGWALIPFVGYTSADRDGDAIKYDGWHGGVNGAWRNENWIVGGGVRIGSKSSDAANPVFNERVDGDFYEIALNVDYKLPFFGGENWYATGLIAYADEDAEVEFHDQTNLIFAAGVAWRFGQNR